VKFEIYPDKKEASIKAAQDAERRLNEVIEERGKANFVVATGLSQVDLLQYLAERKKVDWSKTEMFQLDEYIGISDKHPSSFRYFLQDYFLGKVKPKEVHTIRGEANDPERECSRLNKLLEDVEIDLALVGIGENGHLAFNDPPANFDINEPYIIVELDRECREQQVKEGWFSDLKHVPKEAISMSVNQIMESSEIICTVPSKRKAKAVKNCFEGDISPEYPASILRNHERATVYLDQSSASLLNSFDE